VRLRHLILIGASGVLAAGTLWAGKPKNAQPTVGDLTGRQVEVHTDKKVDAGANRAMENYREFLNLNSNDPALRAEAMRRLGDLNLEASEIERGEREQTSADALQSGEAIKLYTTLLESYPDYRQSDGVLYQLARAYESNGQPEQALDALDRLVSRFPSSPLIDEAQFRRGEILFSAKRYPDAERAYAEVIRRGPKSTFYEQSLYKDGWSLFKLAKSDESLASFGKLLDRKLVDPKDPHKVIDMQTLSRPERELLDDTFRVTSITFSYLDGSKSIDEFVAKRNNPPYSYLLYSALGDLYITKERYQDAAETYEAFVKRDPIDANAPLLQVRAIEAYRKGGFASLVLTGKEQFLERYGFGTPFWTGRDRAQFPAVVAELKSSVKELAQYHHSEAQKTKKQSEYILAARWYRSYLDWFPNEPESADSNFLLAEVLFEAKQYKDATKEYERTAYAYPFNARSAEAAYAALLSYDAYEKQLTDPSQAAEKQAWHAASVESGLKFATTYPQHKEAASVLTRTARELFEIKDLDRAVDTAQRVLALQPPVDATKRRTALTVIAHSRFDQGRYAEAEGAYTQLLAVIPPGDKEQKEITEKLAASVYKQAEAKKAAGNEAGAIDDFLRVAQVAPDSSIRRNAEYDAAAALVTMKNWPRAIDVLEGFRRNHPQDPLVAEATRSLAVAYTETGQSARAAAEFERIADTPTETAELRREALSRSAELYQKSNDRTGAIRCYTKFVERFSAPLDPAMEARQRLADMAAQTNDIKERDRWLQNIIDADRDAGAARTERSKYLAAKATLVFAEPAGSAFALVKLSAPLKKNLALKKDAMERALNAYGKAAQYGVAEVTTAATYQMAELYRMLAKDLMESERPKNLKEDELEEYNVLLEEQAFPFEEKAISIHEANIARANEGVYDEWVRKSFDALAKLKPARYAKAEIGADYVKELR
jgi:cellulose synthase operon protein C